MHSPATAAVADARPKRRSAEAGGATGTTGAFIPTKLSEMQNQSKLIKHSGADNSTKKSRANRRSTVFGLLRSNSRMPNNRPTFA
jgi:hypothetical protein